MGGGRGSGPADNNSKNTGGVQVTAYQNFDLLVMGNEAQLIRKGVVGNTNWNQYIEAIPGQFRSGLSQLQLQINECVTLRD